MDQLEAYYKLYFMPSFSDMEEDESASTRSNDKISDNESSDYKEQEQGMAATSNGND